VTVRAKEDGGHGGREEAVLLLDHLVELGILSFLIESLCFQSQDLQGVFRTLKMLFQFDKKFLQETALMKLLSSLCEDDGSAEYN
jgi:hypothetical protein